MKRDTATNFHDFRNTVREELMTYACIPQVDDVTTNQVWRRFFPTGTAERVLDSETLDRLFVLVALDRQVVSVGSWPVNLGKKAYERELHVFLAILIVSKCDAKAFLSFVEKLVIPDIWTDTQRKLVELPIVHGDHLQELLGGDIKIDIYTATSVTHSNHFQDLLDNDTMAVIIMSIQHEFLAPILEQNREITGQFRRMPYMAEKLIGQGLYSNVYEVVVRSTYSR
jgi:hypothetical protein